MAGQKLFIIRRTLGYALLAALPALCHTAWAQDAEIVLLQGRAEVQQPGQSTWQPATVRQKIDAGSAVRTGEASQMALLLRDQTQVRLNQQSVLQITGTAAEAEGTALQLVSGRVWAQATRLITGVLRAATGGITSSLKRTPLRMTTPSATIGIRGTDWEVVVDGSGNTMVTVFSGEVELSNDLGLLAVGPNEQATVERGKAPVKRLLSDARDRVQWVTSYRPAPRRWVLSIPSSLSGTVQSIETGDYAAALPVLEREAKTSSAAALLLADLYISMGRTTEAITRLQPLARDGSGDAMATALLTRALTIAGRMDEAARLLAAARGTDPEIALARADLARLQGDANVALRLYSEVAAAYPQNHEAWFGVGRVLAEKEDVRPARSALDEAIRLAPESSTYQGERATLGTLSGDLETARAQFVETLNRQPDDFLALTGLGILQLKAGEPEQALESFLKAGVIEPRFARAQVYVGVAYYQLGDRKRALDSLRKASELDAKDPLPYVMLGLIQGDALELNAAVDAAREAQSRMPFLKSLNQILNDQKGSANVGSSLANFGLQEWASFYANEAYSPYWAGSHLFKADRYTGLFNKNSELFQGYLTDPTVFGASNRNSTLVASPGHYGRMDLYLERDNYKQAAVIGTVNGLSVAPVPFAYFASADLSTAKARHDGSDADGHNFTLGLGMRPSYDFGVFAFVTDTRIDATLRTPALTNDALDQSEKRGDLGFNYKLGPENQFWFKGGSGGQTNDVAGSYYSQSTADTLNSAFRTPGLFAPTGTLNRFHSTIDQSDLQFRHSFSRGAWQWNWGLEHTKQTRTGELVSSFSPVRVNVAQSYSVNADEAYVGARFRPMERLAFEGALYYQHMNVQRSDQSSLDVLLAPTTRFTVENTIAEKSYSEINPRLGALLHLTPLQTLRLVGQKWRRPASVGTLGMVDTLGVPVDDRLQVAGGLYKRARLQYDVEASTSTFFQAFLDYERVDNGLGGRRTTITDFELSQLQSLRNRQDVFSPRADIEETPVFAEGGVKTAGFAVNHRLSNSQSIFARYLRRQSEQDGANSGLKIPYIPDNYLLAGSQWALPGRVLLGANAVYRSRRYKDDTNLEPLSAGWSFGFTAYWESEDKRSSLQGVLDNVLSNSRAAKIPDTHFLLRYGYKF